MDTKKRLIIAITGASGIVYGVRLLEALKGTEIETHLILSKASQQARHLETNYSLNEIEALADKVYAYKDIAASLASGSFLTMGMVIAPCTMNTLAEIANGISSNLITRAADVTLKERRRLVLMVRETPLHLVHLENMVKVTQMGGIIAPPVPAFYELPASLDEVIKSNVGRVLDLLGIENQLVQRWDPKTL